MNHTILLVDYDPNSIRRILLLLNGRGYNVQLASDGPAGVEEYRQSRPDLTLIQDLVPKLHGFDVCRQIKGMQAGGGHRPVVILTSRPDHSTLVRTGCDAYLEKPFDDNALLDLIGALLPSISAAS
jgi:CheY-like chemotaxis protein